MKIGTSTQDLKNLPLMKGSKEAPDPYRSSPAPKNLSTSVNAYLILKKHDKILLLLRRNTGYLDEHWSFPAGHVELGESATDGMIREAKEELGITLSIEDLKVVHIMHRKTNRLNIDIFFECISDQGDIENREPEKCGGLEFFSPISLPSPVVDYTIFVLKAVEEKRFYSEWGFSKA
ncbi:MAG: NUDIX domain-containing protein [Parachlamydiales bacterium]|nr:NUDIX domain-containing protein [Parachlamydiales bacterium]